MKASNLSFPETYSQNPIEEFITSQVISRGLDERTAKAYRLDLEHLYTWLEQNPGMTAIAETEMEAEAAPLAPAEFRWEETMEAYLGYLSREKGLQFSTVSRKYRVFGYYLSYLAEQKLIPDCRPLKLVGQVGEEQEPADSLPTACCPSRRWMLSLRR